MPNPRKRKTLTDRGLAALEPEPGKRRHVFDSLIPGLAVRVTERGVKTFVLITRLHGKQRWAPRYFFSATAPFRSVSFAAKTKVTARSAHRAMSARTASVLASSSA